MSNLVEIGTGILDPNKVTLPPGPASSDLESLLRSVVRAIDQGDLSLALRLADRARRIASKDPTCILLYARLLIRAGFAKQALDYLQDETDPSVLLVRGIAFFESGSLNEASKCCADLLHRFSVDALEGLASLASQLCRAHGDLYPGWIGVDDALNLVGEVKQGSPLRIECSAGNCLPVRFQDARDEWVSFTCELPAGSSGPIVAQADRGKPLASGIHWPLDFRLSAWAAVEGDDLVGEAQLGWSPRLSLTLEISKSGQPAHRALSVSPDSVSGACSFSSSLLPFEVAAADLYVYAVLPDGRRVEAIGCPLTTHRQVDLNTSESQNVGSRIIGNQESSSSIAERIDIIVPVYRGLEETLNCLESVLRTTDRERAEVVVINDASDDSQVCDALAFMASRQQITLIANSRNLGFAGAVNRGIKLHPDRDVILLNSDTRVFGDWMERLTRAAHLDANIGTVTPLGQGGSITNYAEGESEANAFAEKIDRIASQVNAGRVVDIPVGVGFCMYIKRACFDQTGELDALTFGRGYGEENDFCLRATSLGWRHVAATDVFVEHRGGRSFGETKTVLQRRNSRILEALHPGYTALIQDFGAKNALLEARRAIDIERLLDEAVSPVLLITHDLYGGVKRHVRQREAELSSAGHTVLVLQRSASSDSTTMVSLKVDSLGLESLVFDLPKDLSLLDQLCRDLCFSHIELHNFLRLPLPVLKMIGEIDVSYDAYIHDYSWICPRIALIDGSGRYCGEPALASCETCVRNNGSALEDPLTVSELRERSARMLRLARKVVVPSTDVRERLARYFPEQEFETTPWEAVSIDPPSIRATTPSERLRVAVIGAIGVPKGYQVLLECARDAAARNLNLEFIVVGYTVDDQPLLDTERVFITGPYEEDEVEILLDRECCDVAFFPSVTAETWCYSLTHAMKRGLPIVAFNLGAQAERLRSYPAAELLLPSFNAQQVNFALLQMRRKFDSPPERLDTVADELADNDEWRLPDIPGGDLVSSVQVLRLPEGIYCFTVKQGGAVREADGVLALPALQVGDAPDGLSGSVDFLTGSSSGERWLAHRTDMVVVRIAGGDASLSLTSVHKQDSSSLAVEVERLNAHANWLIGEVKEAKVFSERSSDSFPIRMTAHIRYVGDLDFDTGLAGWPGQKMWIEGFAISAVGNLPPDSLEYRGLVANGLQTPWLKCKAFCGSRGEGMPLLGYAVRLRPGFGNQYVCTYSGSFFSGAKVGPVQNGELCSSDLPGDPLEAIEIRLLHRSVHMAAAPDRGVAPVYG